MSGRVHVGAVVCLLLLAVPSWSQLGGGIEGAGGGYGGGGLGGGVLAGTGFPVEVHRTPLWLVVGPCSVPENDEVSGIVSLGPVEVLGTVTGDVISFGGQVTLAESADVWGNVTAVCADVARAEGAQVHGEVYANALPDMALIDIEHRGIHDQVFRIGRVELRPGQKNPIAMLVLGGDVVVGRGVLTGEIIAIGGDVIVEPGAEVAKVCAVGGEVVRPEGREADRDEVIPSVIIPCGIVAEAAGGRDAPVGGSTWAAVSHRCATQSLSLSLRTSGGDGGAVSVQRATGPGLSFGLTETVTGQRSRVRQRASRGGGGGYGGGSGVGSAQDEATPERDAQFQSSMWLGAGIRLDITAASGLVGQPETSVTRSIKLGVPARRADTWSESETPRPATGY